MEVAGEHGKQGSAEQDLYRRGERPRKSMDHSNKLTDVAGGVLTAPRTPRK